jgi:hypothetical protein
MRNRTFFSLLLIVGALAVRSANGSIIFDQSATNGNSIDFVDYRVADDFTLTGAATLDAVNFWYFVSPSGGQQSDLSNVTYGIYSSVSGALGTLLFSGTVTPSTSATLGSDFFATITLPDLSLGSGTYWLELHAGTSFADGNNGITVWWETADDNATAQALINTGSPPGTPNTPTGVSGYEQLAFQLDATTSAPEPSSFLLAAPVLAMLSRWRLRRRRASLAIDSSQ